jgi:FkbM family methyltransferase
MKINAISFDKMTFVVPKPHEVVELFKNYDIDLYGVIHVGAHYGQEYNDYVSMGMKNIIYIEPLKDNYKVLLESLPQDARVKTFNIAIGNMTGEIDMFVETANRGQSSSVLEPGTHLDTYPSIVFDKKETVKIDKLDNLEFDRSLYNVLNIDVQGYELEVLKGATETLKSIDVIFSEVNTGEVYKGCAKMDEIDAFLKPFGFVNAYNHLYANIGYGDAIYIKQWKI